MGRRGEDGEESTVRKETNIVVMKEAMLEDGTF